VDEGLGFGSLINWGIFGEDKDLFYRGRCEPCVD